MKKILSVSLLLFSSFAASAEPSYSDEVKFDFEAVTDNNGNPVDSVDFDTTTLKNLENWEGHPTNQDHYNGNKKISKVLDSHNVWQEKAYNAIGNFGNTQDCINEKKKEAKCKKAEVVIKNETLARQNGGTGLGIEGDIVDYSFNFQFKANSIDNEGNLITNYTDPENLTSPTDNNALPKISGCITGGKGCYIIIYQFYHGYNNNPPLALYLRWQDGTDKPFIYLQSMIKNQVSEEQCVKERKTESETTWCEINITRDTNNCINCKEEDRSLKYDRYQKATTPFQIDVTNPLKVSFRVHWSIDAEKASVTNLTVEDLSDNTTYRSIDDITGIATLPTVACPNSSYQEAIFRTGPEDTEHSSKSIGDNPDDITAQDAANWLAEQKSDWPDCKPMGVQTGMYWSKSFDSTGTSGISDLVSIWFDNYVIAKHDKTPQPPQNVTTTRTDTNALSLSWNDVDYADEYKVEVKINNDWSTTTATIELSHPFNNLLPGNYAYRVMACNADGCSEPSAESDVFAVIPSTPTITSAVATGVDTNKLQWVNADNADINYQISIKFNNNSWTAYSDYYSTSSLTYNWSGLNAGTRTYKVRACHDFAGCSPSSAQSTAVITLPAPTTPVATVSGNNITLNWDDVTNADSYRVAIYNNAWTGYNYETSLSETISSSMFFSNLNSGTTKYKVRACRDGICFAPSDESNTVTIKLPPNSPGTPYASVSGSSINLNWNNVTGAEWYEVAIQFNNYSWTGYNYSTSSSSYSWSNLGEGDRKYKVRACNTAGCSNSSSVSNTATILPPTPGAPNTPVATLNGNSVTVNWNNVAYADSYKVSIQFNNNSWTGYNYSTSSSSMSWSNLGSGSRRYRVKACKAGVCYASSGTSNTVTN